MPPNAKAPGFTPAKSTVPATIAATVRNEEETIATHVSAVVAAVAGTLALVHPGFHVPALAEELVTPISYAGAVALEIYNLITRRSLKKAIVGLLEGS